MTEQINDGGPAFPAMNFIVPSDLEARHVARLGETQGMSLRDWLAGMAMQSLIMKGPDWVNGDGSQYRDAVSKQAYDQSDAMLKQREAK